MALCFESQVQGKDEGSREHLKVGPEKNGKVGCRQRKQREQGEKQ